MHLCTLHFWGFLGGSLVTFVFLGEYWLLSFVELLSFYSFFFDSLVRVSYVLVSDR